MKKALFIALCSVLWGENAITAANSQRLVFEAQPNAFDDYNSVFVAFDKGASIVQSYEKLARMHAAKGFAEKSGENAQNDADGCACQGLVPKIEPYKDFNHEQSTYVWRTDKRLVVERECWGAGFFYFELESVSGGTKITAKFSRD